MEELLKKLSSYNLFNYLLPGIVFVVLAKEALGFSLYVDNLVLGVFFYYFLGLVISRIGSVIIEPIFKALKIIQFLEYPRYIKAAKLDEKLETFSEINNTFRTIVSMFLCLGIMKLLLCLTQLSPMVKNAVLPGIIILGFILFVLAYRKQCSYITKRIIETEKNKTPAEPK